MTGYLKCTYLRGTLGSGWHYEASMELDGVKLSWDDYPLEVTRNFDSDEIQEWKEGNESYQASVFNMTDDVLQMTVNSMRRARKVYYWGDSSSLLAYGLDLTGICFVKGNIG